MKEEQATDQRIEIRLEPSDIMRLAALMFAMAVLGTLCANWLSKR